MSELKSLMKNRVKCCDRSGANGESKLWSSALNRIEELEGALNEIGALAEDGALEFYAVTSIIENVLSEE